ncbi:MAG: allantoinase [Planctomycetota bacterium]|nr:MAG: allantoinase [Planctomycetota bacterium]
MIEQADAPLRALRSRRLITPDGERAGTLLLRDGRIEAVLRYGKPFGDGPLLDVGELPVLPGFVDTHVHVNEPGRTEWEGFESATRAAAAGGVTTLVDMPLNSIPPTTTLAGLEAKRSAASGHCWVDVGFWGGVVPGNLADLQPLLDAGVRGFKCFLIDSGVSEFAHVQRADLAAALPVLAEAGRPLLAHAELPGPIEAALASLPPADSAANRHYATWLASRPHAAEDEAVALLVELCRASGASIHVVHHASAAALPLLARARQDALPLTAETCPHYLHFAAETIPDGATAFKCAPPIRERENNEQLWAALSHGLLDGVVSDHSPCSPALKLSEQGDFQAAWGGIAGLQLGVSVTWTGARARGHDLAQLVRWMAVAPARLAGLQMRKGALAPGYDADMVVFDPEQEFVVTPSELHHRHALTPYAGETLRGRVRSTWLAGRCVFRDGEFEGAPRGQLL